MIPKFNQIFSTFKFIYIPSVGDKFELRDKGVPFGYPGDNDRKIIAINKLGEEKVVIESIIESLPELATGNSLGKLSFPVGSTRLYFVEYRPSSDGSPLNVYAFDLKTLAFARLPNASRYYADYGSKSLSPDGKYIVTITNHDNYSDKQKIFLLDLNKDSVGTIVSLSGNEVVDQCSDRGDCWGSYNDMKWVDNDTFEYSVYDSTKYIDADWKTYTNTKYNYEFKYPNDWKVESAYSYKSLQETDNAYVFWEGEEMSGGGVTLVVRDDITYFDQNDKVIDRKEQIINNIKWNILNMRSDSQDYSHVKIAYTIFKDKLFEFVSIAGSDYVPYNNKFDDILSTFQFIK